MSSVKKNFVYNIFYQLFTVILPLITAPYVSRILGANGIGVYSYTYSISNYFLLFVMLGIANHGNRSIASTDKKKSALGECFINNYIIQLSVGSVVVIIYLLYSMIFAVENRNYALIQILVVLSGIFDINWFFWGLEKFKLTLCRNFVCKIVSVACIFLFVKTAEDLWKYVLIMSLTMLTSQLLLWKFLFKEIIICKPQWKIVKNNLKPILILFLPILSYSLYRIMDKIMIGSFSSMIEVGYYENAEKILNIPIGIVTALGNVMLPRISKLLAEGDSTAQFKYIKTSMLFVTIVEGGLCFGISAISKLFIPIYYGTDFIKTGYILEIIVFTALISGWANVIRTQILIPKKMDSIYVISMISAAVVNFILNVIYIPKFGAYGAIIGTVAAEILVLIVQALSVKGEIPWRDIAHSNIIYFILGFSMWCIVKSLDHILTVSAIASIAIEILIGGIFYIVGLRLICYNRKDELYYIVKRG